MNTDTQAIEDIAKALKQLVSCNPQLLYKAAQKCCTDFFFDKLKAEVENKPKLAETLLFRSALCQMLAGLLLRSGRAHLDDDDVVSMAVYLNLVRDTYTEDAIPSGWRDTQGDRGY